MKMISPKLSVLSSAVLALASVAFAAGGNTGFATSNVGGAKNAIGTQTTGGVADPGEGIRDSFAQNFPMGGLLFGDISIKSTPLLCANSSASLMLKTPRFLFSLSKTRSSLALIWLFILSRN